MKIDEHIFTKILLSAFLLCSQIISYAQQTSFNYILEVVDEKGSLINDVYVIDASAERLIGITSNGRVEFVTNQNKLNIRFSHLSFKAKTITFDDLLVMESLEIRVVLEPKSFGLNEVSVSTKKRSLAYKNEAINVMDYEFYNNSIIMLCGMGKNKQLRLASEDGYDITSMFLPKGAKGLFKDCLNKIYLLYNDSVYDVKFTDTSLYIKDQYTRYEFDKSAAKCEAAIGKNLILGELGEHGQEVNYFIKPDGTNKYTFLKQIINYKDKSISEYYKRTYQAMGEGGLNTGSANTISGLFAARKLDRDYTYYKYVNSRLLYAPIFEIEDQFVLFNTYEGYIEWYSPQGKLKKIEKLNFLNQENWANLLLFDKAHNDVYVFKKNGTEKYIQKLDLQKASFDDNLRVQLSEHPFSENYQVKEGYIYYLYREDHQPGLPKKLFKLKL